MFSPVHVVCRSICCVLLGNIWIVLRIVASLAIVDFDRLGYGRVRYRVAAGKHTREIRIGLRSFDGLAFQSEREDEVGEEKNSSYRAARSCSRRDEDDDAGKTGMAGR